MRVRVKVRVKVRVRVRVRKSRIPAVAKTRHADHLIHMTVILSLSLTEVEAQFFKLLKRSFEVVNHICFVCWHLSLTLTVSGCKPYFLIC